MAQPATTELRPARSRRQQPTRMGRKPPPPNETPRQRFGRIGQARMVNALHAIRLIGNLAASGYEYTADDIGLMHSTLKEALDLAFDRFKQTSALPKLEETFRLQV